MSHPSQATTLPSALYLVATPIGCVEDITLRALRILAAVDRIFAEDTRVTAQLLSSHQIRTPLTSLNAHSEEAKVPQIIAALRDGQSIALVSDAGTPAVSDPGRIVVAACHAEGLAVVPVPGASALTALASVAGLPASPFQFVGFLPPKGASRRRALTSVLEYGGTTVLYEAPHRMDDLAVLLAELAAGRTVCVGRELTKTYEEVVSLPAEGLSAWLMARPDRIRGEFALMIGPPRTPQPSSALDATRLLRALAGVLPPSKAASITAELTGLSKRSLYAQLTDSSEQ
ncbi:MAG: 16S rRNA (cytidine(1402)-2'-O)-methyltransferase [Gammaproteobacteria bacterium]|nr:16S rRNA (cytidine(1402)-2'-O)-methyltransferase [Gammaproteobacteria bacterium]